VSSLNLSASVVQSLILMATFHGRPGELALLAGGRTTDRPHLDAFARAWLARGLNDWRHAQTWMARAGLTCGTEGGGWRLTEAGQTLAAAVLRRRPMWLDTAYTVPQRPSRTLASLRAELQGVDLGFHELMDDPQISALLRACRVDSAAEALHFGCGTGRLTARLAELTGARWTGVDTAGAVIRQARARARRDPDLRWAEIDPVAPPVPVAMYDVALTIDALYFLPDLSTHVEQLARALRPGGRLCIVQSHWGPATGGARRRSPGRSPVAGALRAAGLSFTSVDLTSLEAEHWERRVNLLQANRPGFSSEGLDELYEQRFAEACTFHLWPAEQRARHLFVARL